MAFSPAPAFSRDRVVVLVAHRTVIAHTLQPCHAVLRSELCTLDRQAQLGFGRAHAGCKHAQCRCLCVIQNENCDYWVVFTPE